MTVSIKTPTDFANALLGALNIKPTKQNVTDVVGWENTEGGNWHNPDAYNPLDTTLDLPGAVSTNSAGVKAYTSWQQGINATVDTLTQSNPAYNYNGIISALQNNDNWTQFKTAVANSSWGGKGNPYILSFATPPGTTAGGTSGTVSPNPQEANVGAQATTSGNAAGNSPSTTSGNGPLTGMAGILQAMNQMYNPGSLNKTILWVIPDVPADIEHTATEIFTRATSAILSVGMVLIGLKVMLSGSSDSGSSSGGVAPALTFINNQKRTALASERIRTRQQEESNRNARADARAAQAEANRKAKAESSSRWADIHETYATNPKK